MSPACQASHASGVSFRSWRAITIVCCTECFDSRRAMLISVPANSPALYRGSTPAAWRSAMTCRSHAERVSENSIINAAHRACAFANSRWCSTSASINSAVRPVFWSVDSSIPRTLQGGYDTPRSEREAPVDNLSRGRSRVTRDGTSRLKNAVVRDVGWTSRAGPTVPAGWPKAAEVQRYSGCWALNRYENGSHRWAVRSTIPSARRTSSRFAVTPLRPANYGHPNCHHLSRTTHREFHSAMLRKFI